MKRRTHAPVGTCDSCTHRHETSEGPNCTKCGENGRSPFSEYEEDVSVTKKGDRDAKEK